MLWRKDKKPQQIHKQKFLMFILDLGLFKSELFLKKIGSDADHSLSRCKSIIVAHFISYWDTNFFEFSGSFIHRNKSHIRTKKGFLVGPESDHCLNVFPWHDSDVTDSLTQALMWPCRSYQLKTCECCCWGWVSVWGKCCWRLVDCWQLNNSR